MAAVRSLFEYESPPGSPAISLEGIAGVHMHRPSCPEPHTKWDAAAAIAALGAFSDDDDDDDDGSDGKTSSSEEVTSVPRSQIRHTRSPKRKRRRLNLTLREQASPLTTSQILQKLDVVELLTSG